MTDSNSDKESGEKCGILATDKADTDADNDDEA